MSYRKKFDQLIRDNLLRKFIPNLMSPVNSVMKIWAILIPIFVGVALGIAIFQNWDRILSFPWHFRWPDLVLHVTMHIFAIITMSIAWHYLLLISGNHGTWERNFQIYIFSLLARRVPLPLWYVGSRVIQYKKEGVRGSLILGATLLEAILIFFSGMISFILLIPWYSFSTNEIWVLLPPLIIVSITLILILRPSFTFELINKLLHFLKKLPLNISINRQGIMIPLILYLLTWFLDGLGLFFFVSALSDQHIGIVDTIGISTISSLVGMLTLILPSGFGLKELTMSGLLTLYFPLSATIVISIIYRVSQTAIEGFITLLVWRFDKNSQ